MKRHLRMLVNLTTLDLFCARPIVKCETIFGVADDWRAIESRSTSKFTYSATTSAEQYYCIISRERSEGFR
jgi:hypothetical protein